MARTSALSILEAVGAKLIKLLPNPRTHSRTLARSLPPSFFAGTCSQHQVILFPHSPLHVNACKDRHTQPPTPCSYPTAGGSSATILRTQNGLLTIQGEARHSGHTSHQPPLPPLLTAPAWFLNRTNYSNLAFLFHRIWCLPLLPPFCLHFPAAPSVGRYKPLHLSPLIHTHCFSSPPPLPLYFQLAVSGQDFNDALLQYFQSEFERKNKCKIEGEVCAMRTLCFS